jgi:WD40 repeat protein
MSVALGEVDGQAVIVSNDNWAVKLWDAKEGRPIGEPLIDLSFPIVSIAAGEVNGRAVIVTGDNETVRLWDLKTSVSLATLRMAQKVIDLDLGPEGRLAVATSRGIIAIEFRC